VSAHAAAEAPERPPTVLVVDDEADISTILTLTFRRAGFQVTTARDGLEALEALEQALPDAVILDVMMPRLDGFETLRRIREQPRTRELPVIMLTAKSRVADRMRGFDHGADDYVGKPFEPPEILARVRSVLKRGALSRLASPLVGPLGDWFSAEGLAQLGRDLETAREIQTRLLPAVPTTLAGLEAAGILRPSTVVGGDFFDIVPMPDRVAVAVGDVSGKGIPAALLMVMTRTLLREIARSEAQPAEVLSRLNTSLCRDMPPSMFVTLALAVLDPARPGEVRLALAGHPPPVRVSRGAGVAVGAGGLPLGAFETAAYDEQDIALGPGDALVLYSDGAIETEGGDGRRPGLAGLCDALAGGPADAAGRAAELCARVTALAGGGATGRLRDDLTVFVLARPA
jgi:sigma-B regulation protein RsbU (phosphoserine phosphatase)